MDNVISYRTMLDANTTAVQYILEHTGLLPEVQKYGILSVTYRKLTKLNPHHFNDRHHTHEHCIRVGQ